MTRFIPVFRNSTTVKDKQHLLELEREKPAKR